MRHQIKKIKLGTSTAHTKSILRNLTTSLIEHGKIETTEKRAKALKKYIDKLIGKTTKQDEKNTARSLNEIVFTKSAQKKFKEMKEKFSTKGSSVRITKLRKRPGDNATVVRIELLT